MRFLPAMSLALIAMYSLAGCGRASKQTSDVPYYKEREEARKKKLRNAKKIQEDRV